MLKSALIQSLSVLSSLRLTVVGLVWLVICIVPTGDADAVSSGSLLYPLCLLAINLLAAIISNRQFHYQPWLLSFHIGLLLIVALSALDYMMRFEARVELAEGQSLSSALLKPVVTGGWYDKNSIDVDFIQGPVRIGFYHGLNREKTFSTIFSGKLGGNNSIVVGDQVSYTENGYRFSTTSNKGYAAKLRWYDNSNNMLEGNIHFPSFPFRDWQQKQNWITPDGTRVELELVFDSPVNESTYWSMHSNIDAQLRITFNGSQYLLNPGQRQQVNSGSMVFDDLRIWMGYRVDYNPVLPWLLSVAIATVLSLFMYLRNRLFRRIITGSVVSSPARKHGYVSH